MLACNRLRLVVAHLTRRNAAGLLLALHSIDRRADADAKPLRCGTFRWSKQPQPPAHEDQENKACPSMPASKPPSTVNQNQLIWESLFDSKKRYDGLLPTGMRRLKSLENATLKRLVADLSSTRRSRRTLCGESPERQRKLVDAVRGDWRPALDARLSYRAEDVVRPLEQTCASIGYPRTTRVDQGTEFVSRDLDQWACTNGVTPDFSRPGPTDFPLSALARQNGGSAKVDLVAVYAVSFFSITRHHMARRRFH